MDNTKPFIDAGWYTVPLAGELRRIEDGKKTLPVFPKNWKEVYAKSRNNRATAIGGALTGELSGILAIDCDNQCTWDMFRALDPDYAAVMISVGKGEPAGTLIYKHTKEVPDTFSLANQDGLKLDVYANHGFIYLPTKHNTTKETWLAIPEIKEAPATVIMLLKQLRALKERKVAGVPKETGNARMYLAPLLTQFVERNGKFDSSLFRVLTPKAFREEPQYKRDGYLHPENVPDGRGSEYLMRVSALLGYDESVSSDLYIQVMHFINDMFAEPMDPDRFDQTILSPMIEGKSTQNGEVIWRHDPQWEELRLTFRTKRGTTIDVGIDDLRNTYYCFDIAADDVRSFERDAELMAYIDAIAYNPMKKAEFKHKMPLVRVSSDPSQPFGFISSGLPNIQAFNLFKRTHELEILHTPEIYMSEYQRPYTILNFFNSFIPNDEDRLYLLQFIKQKLRTFKYSPVVLYFLGVHGSGKDTLVALLERIVDRVARPTVDEFLEVYNGWLADAYFVQLDEYGNQLTSARERDQALGKLKAYTGKREVQIREMRTDSFKFQHNATFIMTANKNPLMLEDGDRRIALFQTPNKLSDQEWFTSDSWDSMMAEIKDFCYYLATEVPDINPLRYMEPPNSMAKRELVANSMYAADRLAYAMKHGMKDYLVKLGEHHGVAAFVTAIKRGRVMSEEIEELYDELTDYKGDPKALHRALRTAGIHAASTTRQGNRAVVYSLSWAEAEATPFEDSKDDDADFPAIS